LTIVFQLQGQEFMALNGGPYTHFTPAISFIVNCETQEEIDEYWAKLSQGGEIEQCGWLKDQFDISWQIVPTILDEMFNDKDSERSNRVMNALLKMTRIIIADLEKA
jgi:predicted 3-demethylubiquinone-9 3-methyltransferase (glyoxalase superfamily)